MTLAQEMFAIAPASGHANLSPRQADLLVGKARFLFQAHNAGFAVVPTIVLTQAAWNGLQAERGQHQDRLRLHWVATLFRLVARDGKPPALVVRTSLAQPSAGLMPSRLNISPPANEAESVDPKKALARAITDAFASYDGIDPGEAARQIVVVQAMAEGELKGFVTRHPKTGMLGPRPAGNAIGGLPPGLEKLTLFLDGTSGCPLTCLVAERDGAAQLLSVRVLSTSIGAEVEAAVDRVARKLWDERRAVAAINPSRVSQMLHPGLSAEIDTPSVATGLGVSPGAASGIIVFSAEDAARQRARGRHCILVVVETGPTDIDGMKAATGILTARGGMTSHAAVIARITGRPCVAGVRSLSIDPIENTCRIGEQDFRAGDRITIDGTDGNIYRGALPLSQPHMGGALATLLSWSDVSRSIRVRTNVETVDSAQTALSFGAEGIGLARSEHMFFSPERLVALRRMILSEDENDRARALTGLVDFQTGDYADLFIAMAGRPVTVRLFDPPLHEFLPRTDEDIIETAQSLGLEVRALRLRLDRLSEVNPMLGHRGVRLAVTYPEILEMQMQALMAGVRAAAARQSEPVTLEVMVPFVSTTSEVTWIRERVMAMVDAADLPDSARRRFAFGTMIELPRAALRAADIAREVDFFSFGTNDLTQTTFGISRDDAPAFLSAYRRKDLYEHDPFVTIDEKGVGELISIAIQRGRSANPNLKIGICGEHAGDPASLRFFAGLGVDYVSCSPYRVPVARLTLAQVGR